MKGKRGGILPFLAMVLTSFNGAAQPDIRFRTSQLFLNDPFGPDIKLETVLESGGLYLKLRNNRHEAVCLNQVLLQVSGQKATRALLENPLDLAPADRHYIELGNTLKPFFTDTPTVQERLVNLKLSVEPEGFRQPIHFSFRVRFRNHQFLSVRYVAPSRGSEH